MGESQTRVLPRSLIIKMNPAWKRGIKKRLSEKMNPAEANYGVTNKEEKNCEANYARCIRSVSETTSNST